jgi:hypothetical protein
MKNFTIYEDGNGGQLSVQSNDIVTTDALYTLAYLKMFGGNLLADTKPTSDAIELHHDWWGNNKNKPSSGWINSQTERILKGIVLNSQSVEKIKTAVEKDVESLTQFGTISVTVNILSLNNVKITIDTEQGDNLSLIWDNTKNEVIQEL